MSSFSEGQTHQLMEALEAKGFTPNHVTKLGQFARLGDIPKLLDGQLALVDVAEVPLDTTVHVDRSVHPTYPDWMYRVLHLDLECTGPDDYNLTTAVSLWLHDDQKGGVATGNVIYAFLKEHGMIESCLSLQDALAIQKKGVAVFRRVFGDNVVYFWKSVVRRRDSGRLLVPYLYVSGDEVVLRWSWLGGGWYGHEPAARFASS